MLKARDFWPHTVFVDDEAKEDKLTKRVLQRLSGVNVVNAGDGRDPISELNLIPTVGNDADPTVKFSAGKRVLQLTRYKGTWLKACPGTSQHVCCNLWVVNPGEGCPLDCTYCYLQSYLKRNPTLKIYTNPEDMIEAIRSRAVAEPGRLFRVGTGEVIDSLVWDELTDLSTELVPFFGSQPNLMLELKSKFSYVDNLVSLKNEHQGKTVVSWSVNAEPITNNDEAFTSSLNERLEAAAKVVEAGYRVGFHFDPVVHFDGWQDAYRDAVCKVLAAVDTSRIAWISVSTLRYKREMQRTMQDRFPESKIPHGEQFLAKDGKLRYVQPLRFALVNFVWKEIKSAAPNVPAYMCMESSAAWRYISGGSPVAGSELVEIFTRRGRLSNGETGAASSNSLGSFDSTTERKVVEQTI